MQTTKQFGEEIGELREGARQLLLALAQLNTVKTRQPGAACPLFSKLRARFADYGLLGAADMNGRIFCTSEPTSYSSVADQPFFERAMAQPGLAVTQAAADPDPIDEQVLASLGQLQREGRPDIVQQLIELFFKGAAGLLIDLVTARQQLTRRSSIAPSKPGFQTACLTSPDTRSPDTKWMISAPIPSCCSSITMS